MKLLLPVLALLAAVVPAIAGAQPEGITLLADRRNGAPIPPAVGPYRVVIPDERRHARWVRQVTEIDVLPLP